VVDAERSGRGRGSLPPVTLRGEPTWGAVAAPASEPVAERATGAAAATDGTEFDGAATAAGSLKDLEAEVYAARNLHGDERTRVRRLFANARKRMSDATYRRALELARDSVLLSVEECLNGAVAMEWEPTPRPEFSLATIEAAVAEQERESRSA
jgi:hypothetical protein